MKMKFEHYYKKYYEQIFRVAFAQVKNHADAEDVVQETFIKLMRYQPEFENAEHEKAWFIRTTLNICKDLFKSRQYSEICMEEVPEIEKEYINISKIDDDDTLWKVLALPEKYKNCLYLFYYEDYSIKEISSVLQMQENTVKTNLKRGRERLKNMMQESD